MPNSCHLTHPKPNNENKRHSNGQFLTANPSKSGVNKKTQIEVRRRRVKTYIGEKGGGGEHDGRGLSSVHEALDAVLEAAADASGRGAQAEGGRHLRSAVTHCEVELGGRGQGGGGLAPSGGQGGGCHSCEGVRTLLRQIVGSRVGDCCPGRASNRGGLWSCAVREKPGRAEALMGSSEMGDRARVGWIRLPPSHWRRLPPRGHSTPRSPPSPLQDKVSPSPRHALLPPIPIPIPPSFSLYTLMTSMCQGWKNPTFSGQCIGLLVLMEKKI